MSISSVNYDSTTSSTASTKSDTDLGITSTDFLQLMVQQLQNQNPLDPMDANSYVDKLVSYASYDAQTDTADNTEALANGQSSSISENGLGYIGQKIEATGNTNTLTDGAATWNYKLGSNAESSKISISDENGKVVWSGDGETTVGSHSFTWDGKTTSGVQLDDGASYTLSVNATDADGDDVNGSTSVVGTVTGIDMTGDESLLMIGSSSVSVKNVLSIQEI
ncbi:flagellar hook assembly protein FlgD [Roseibium algae]|uniref:Basal-body rod modification protein FlgD n=1 Tax=Roseibium algae TaxID=3123038 RepID=A0ABU8TF75_9HYPH